LLVGIERELPRQTPGLDRQHLVLRRLGRAPRLGVGHRGIALPAVERVQQPERQLSLALLLRHLVVLGVLRRVFQLFDRKLPPIQTRQIARQRDLADHLHVFEVAGRGDVPSLALQLDRLRPVALFHLDGRPQHAVAKLGRLGEHLRIDAGFLERLVALFWVQRRRIIDALGRRDSFGPRHPERRCVAGGHQCAHVVGLVGFVDPAIADDRPLPHRIEQSLRQRHRFVDHHHEPRSRHLGRPDHLRQIGLEVGRVLHQGGCKHVHQTRQRVAELLEHARRRVTKHTRPLRTGRWQLDLAEGDALFRERLPTQPPVLDEPVGPHEPSVVGLGMRVLEQHPRRAIVVVKLELRHQLERGAMRIGGRADHEQLDLVGPRKPAAVIVKTVEGIGDGLHDVLAS